MRVVFGVLLIVAAAVAVFALPLSADDAPGCEGLEAYSAAMMAEERPIEADENVFTMSSSDWLAYAESALDFHDRIAAIEPPTWAAEWHEVRLDLAGFKEQVGRAAALEGVFVVLGFEDTIEELNERDAVALAAAVAACPDFEAFALEWNPPEGTPVASPVK